ncbi:MAG: DsrE/DsrF/DrsH-like family protein [Candidatus Thermoplasmatota archaeon]|nr:DsrE/DsrF/DrsH-like family protein [Candidatus Thermoplasmatota archaeon]
MEKDTSYSREDETRHAYVKTMDRDVGQKVGTMTIILTEDTYDKALTTFNIAVAGIEMGMKVMVFFTARGINVIKKAYKPRRSRWGEAPIGWKETFIRRRGGQTLSQLMYQARDMGVELLACYTSMISIGLKEPQIITGVKTIRMVEFLEFAIHSDTQFVIG